jgi:hypothetical protein
MNKQQYIHEIVSRSCLPRMERERLKRDLINEIDSALERGEYIEDIMERMGDPDKIAAELYANTATEAVRPFREYKSSVTLFGLPLVHVVRGEYGYGMVRVRGSHYQSQMNRVLLPTAKGVIAIGMKAKGIIALGNFSAGVISIGNFSTGLISIGNMSFGLLTLGNLAVAPLLAVGNMAGGIFSIGNVATGYAALGNVAVGVYAVGNEAKGTFAFSINNLAMQLGEVKTFLANLDVAEPVKHFFGIIERVLGIINEPQYGFYLYVTVFTVLLASVLFFSYLGNKAKSE